MSIVSHGFGAQSKPVLDCSHNFLYNSRNLPCPYTYMVGFQMKWMKMLALWEYYTVLEKDQRLAVCKIFQWHLLPWSSWWDPREFCQIEDDTDRGVKATKTTLLEAVNKHFAQMDSSPISCIASPNRHEDGSFVMYVNVHQQQQTDGSTCCWSWRWEAG